MYLQFLSFFPTCTAEVVEIRPNVRKDLAFHVVNIMAADDPATQGARVQAAMIMTQLNRNNTVVG